jgi:peptidoglycan hydrolase-like protein with peptidoglycan-binding domain
LFALVLAGFACLPAAHDAAAGAIRMAALSDDPETSRPIRTGIAHPLVRRSQEALARIGLYKGPINGLMSVETKAAVRRYQKINNISVTGILTEELVVRMETASKVEGLLKRLEEVREERQTAAREALLSRSETRHLVTGKSIEQADPTRDPTPCFRDPSPHCLLLEASESAKAIPKEDMRDWALGEILAAQAKAGLTEDAMATVRRINDPRLIMVALRTTAAKILNRIGDTKSATEQIGSARAEATSNIAARERGKALRHVAAALAEMGRPADALRMMAEVEKPQDRIPVLVAAATAQAHAGGSQLAIATAENIEAARYRAVVFGNIAIAEARAGNFGQARTTVDRAKLLSAEIGLPYASSFAASRIALALTELGKSGDMRFYDEAVQTTEKIADDQLRAHILWTVASERARPSRIAGRYRQGRKSETLIGDPAPPACARSRPSLKSATSPRPRMAVEWRQLPRGTRWTNPPSRKRALMPST